MVGPAPEGGAEEASGRQPDAALLNLSLILFSQFVGQVISPLKTTPKNSEIVVVA
jgi:hypothetical protein